MPAVKIVTVILDDNTTLQYEFDENPDVATVDSAMDGIGGRPKDRD